MPRRSQITRSGGSSVPGDTEVLLSRSGTEFDICRYMGSGPRLFTWNASNQSLKGDVLPLPSRAMFREPHQCVIDVSEAFHRSKHHASFGQCLLPVRLGEQIDFPRRQNELSAMKDKAFCCIGAVQKCIDCFAATTKRIDKNL